MRAALHRGLIALGRGLAWPNGVVNRRSASIGLAAIIGIAAVLRLRGLDRHFFWFDEGLLLDLNLLRQGVQSFTLSVWRNTTYNPGWALVVWLTSRLGGVSLWSMRLPSCIAGVLNVPLTYTAARALKLDRTAALAAAMLAALVWPLVEYSQQVLPYAGIPLLTTATIWVLARLDRDRAKRLRRTVLLWLPLLAAACTVGIANHNSFLMLLPLLAIALTAIAAQRGLLRAQPSDPRALAAFAACLGWISIVSMVFFLPKRGEGYRAYLDPYYAATFRGHLMGYGPFTDAWYKRCVTHSNLVLDVVYFGLSRTFDTFLYASNLFSPLYITPPWGVVAVLLPGLACAGLIAACRRRPGAVPRWLGGGLLLTLAVLFLLSLVRLFPYGGIRQALFLSPLVILITASGWRCASRRWPIAVGALTVAAVVVYTIRAPIYYSDTAARINERMLAAVFHDTGTRTIVIPEMADDFFMINHLGRSFFRRAVADTHWPRFTRMLHRHEPFLLFTHSFLPLSDFQPKALKSPLYHALIEEGFDFSGYTVTPLIAAEGGCFRGGQPNPGTFLYRFRPLPALAGGREACRTEPADGSRTARVLDEIAIAFDRPIDPSTLDPGTIEVWAKAAGAPDASWTRDSRRSSYHTTYEPLWKTALLSFDGPLDPGLYMVVVTDAVRDASGHPFVGGTSRSTFQLQPLRDGPGAAWSGDSVPLGTPPSPSSPDPSAHEPAN